MAVNSFVSNQGTQTPLLTDNNGGTGGTLIPIYKLSMDGQGTYTNGNLFQGTLLQVNNIGTLPNLPQGSINVTAGTIGTVGNIGTLPNIPGGTLNNLPGIGTTGSAVPAQAVYMGAATGANLSGLNASGNSDDQGIVNALQTWSFLGVYDSGDTNYDRARNVNSANGGTALGVLAAGAMGMDTGGTIHPIAVTATSGSAGTIVLPNIPGGTIGSVVGIGSVSGLSNLPGGSIIVTAGTQQALGTIGTLGLGTVRNDARPTQNILTFGTQIANSGASAATIVGSASVGSGTSLWLQDVSIINPNGNVLCVLGFGTTQQGTNVFFRGTLGTSSAAGIEKSFAKPSNAGMTNQDLVFSTGGAGTIDLTISYFISA